MPNCVKSTRNRQTPFANFDENFIKNRQHPFANSASIFTYSDGIRNLKPKDIGPGKSSITGNATSVPDSVLIRLCHAATPPSE
jgi:hypothetical protein